MGSFGNSAFRLANCFSDRGFWGWNIGVSSKEVARGEGSSLRLKESSGGKESGDLLGKRVIGFGDLGEWARNPDRRLRFEV
jgi:hypothetical protein